MKILIEEKVLAKLLESNMFLDYLESFGVDNWDGYSLAYNACIDERYAKDSHMRDYFAAKGLYREDICLGDIVTYDVECMKENQEEEYAST